MTVYVDDMHRYPMGRFGRMKMSHLVADTEEELHAMADRIGVARRWYQGDHYDVALSARAKAVAAGAMTAFRRRQGRLPTPGEADAWMAERVNGIQVTEASDS